MTIKKKRYNFFFFKNVSPQYFCERVFLNEQTFWDNLVGFFKVKFKKKSPYTYPILEDHVARTPPLTPPPRKKLFKLSVINVFCS